MQLVDPEWDDLKLTIISQRTLKPGHTVPLLQCLPNSKKNAPCDSFLSAKKDLLLLKIILNMTFFLCGTFVTSQRSRITYPATPVSILSAYLAAKERAPSSMGARAARAKSLRTLDVTATKATLHRSRRQTEILLKVARWQN